LVVVQAETVVRWHRKGFRRYWRFRSRRRPGRPRISKEVRELIRRMALENPWGARRIHAELAKLGIEVSLATVSRFCRATSRALRCS
jgi:transposase